MRHVLLFLFLPEICVDVAQTTKSLSAGSKSRLGASLEKGSPGPAYRLTGKGNAFLAERGAGFE